MFRLAALALHTTSVGRARLAELLMLDVTKDDDALVVLLPLSTPPPALRAFFFFPVGLVAALRFIGIQTCWYCVSATRSQRSGRAKLVPPCVFARRWVVCYERDVGALNEFSLKKIIPQSLPSSEATIR